MRPILFKQRTVWWPTGCGWCFLLLPPFLFAAFWVFWGEAFLSVTRRTAADTLIVEGWIGREALPVAKKEFERGGYERLVVTGGPNGPSWVENRWNVALAGKKELLRMGFPPDKLLVATSEGVENQRTYTYASSARQTIEAAGLHPKRINVISRGAHARRTQLVYSKVFGPEFKVGIISWNPYGPNSGMWWHSSVRAKELLEETFGFTFEAFFSSGRSDETLKGHLAIFGVMAVLVVLLIRRLRIHSRTDKYPLVIDVPSSSN